MSDQPPYSRLRFAGPIAVTAGILGADGDGLVPGGVDAELHQAFANLSDLLRQHDFDLPDVIQLVVYLTDIGAMDALNAAFVASFDEPRPARTTVGVAALPGGAAVEIEATIATGSR